MVCNDKSKCLQCDKKTSCNMLKSLMSMSNMSEGDMGRLFDAALKDAIYLDSKKAETNKFATSVVDGIYRLVDTDSRATFVMREVINKFLAYIAYKDVAAVDKAITGIVASLLPLLPDSAKAAIGTALQATVKQEQEQTETPPEGAIIN